MSCNDVCLADYDYDSPDFYSDEMRRARKPYKCCECNEAIAKGELHHYATGKWDGTVDTHRTCAACHEIRVVFGCGSWVFWQLWEDIREQIFPIWLRNELAPVDCLARLKTDEAIAKMRAMYAKWRKDNDE